MGSGTFFSKLLSMDPLAQALDLPGSHKYAQDQAEKDAESSAANGGPYTGVAASLAGANAGYAPGGPGSNPNWQPWTPHVNTNFFQQAANLSGNLTPQPVEKGGGLPTGASPAVGFSTQNSYVAPANAPQSSATQLPSGWAHQALGLAPPTQSQGPPQSMVR